MIYDWTDDIFKWKFWNIFKWIFGVLLCIGITWIIWNLSTDINFEKFLLSAFFKQLH